MTPKALRDEILQLPAADRLQLLEDIWDSFVGTPDAVRVSDWHKAELDRRRDQPASGPGLTWEEVRGKLPRRDR